MRWHLSPAVDAPPCGALVMFPLEASEAERRRLHDLLSAAEQARAARFLFPDLASRFTVAHGRLRQLLAPLVGLDARDIQMVTGEHGKPRLAGTAAALNLHFNLSHSDTLGLVGWAQDREIGVDIERWRPMRDEHALVRRFFSAAENAAYDALPADQRSAGFFHCWTRKEAYIKAVGRGLGLPLDSFDVSLEAGSGARLLRASTHCEDTKRWSLAAPAGPPGTSIAVVLESDSVVVLPDIP